MARRANTVGFDSDVVGMGGVAISQGPANAAEGLASTFGALSVKMQGELDRRAVIDATEEGTIAGSEGKPTLRDKTTLSGKAFNDAALSTFANRLDIQSRTKLAELSAQHAADPVAFQKATSAYSTGIITELSQATPTLAAVFKTQFDLLSKQSLLGIVKVKNDLMADQQKATALDLKEALNRSLVGSSGDIFSGDVPRASAAFHNMAVARSRLDTLLSQTRADGLPLFKSTERQKMLQDFEDGMFDMAVKGFVDAAPDKGVALSAILGGKLKSNITIVGDDGKTVPQTLDVMASMTREQQDKAKAYALSQANLEARQVTAQETRARRVQTDLQETTFKTLVQKAEADGLTVDEVNANINNLDGDKYKALMIMSSNGGALSDDGPSVVALETMLHSDPERVQTFATDLFNQKQITKETYKEAMRSSESMGRLKGPKSDFEELSGGLQSQVAAMANSEVGKYFAPTFPLAVQEWRRWWQTFPERTDPKTGQPYARDPTYEEGRAMTLRVLKDNVAPQVFRQFEKSVLGTLPGATVKVEGKTLPGVVENPETKEVDIDRSVGNLKAAYGVDDSTPPDAIPLALTRALAQLRRYDETRTRFADIIERLDNDGRSTSNR